MPFERYEYGPFCFIRNIVRVQLRWFIGATGCFVPNARAPVEGAGRKEAAIVRPGYGSYGTFMGVRQCGQAKPSITLREEEKSFKFQKLHKNTPKHSPSSPHSLMVRSALQLAKNLPLGCHLTHQTRSSCPSKVVTNSRRSRLLTLLSVMLLLERAMIKIQYIKGNTNFINSKLSKHKQPESRAKRDQFKFFAKVSIELVLELGGLQGKVLLDFLSGKQRRNSFESRIHVINKHLFLSNTQKVPFYFDKITENEIKERIESKQPIIARPHARNITMTTTKCK